MYKPLLFRHILQTKILINRHKTDIKLTYNRHKTVIFDGLMALYACYYCFTAPIKASPFEHSCSRCVILLLAFKFSRELNSNMPSCISREVIGCLNSLENWEVRRQLSIPELPSRSPSPYFAPLRCLLRIIASFTSPLTRYLCQFYVGSMSVLCRFYVSLTSFYVLLTC